MKVIIEEYGYHADDVKDVLDGLNSLENVDHIVSVSYVGYYYNQKLQDCVFILPKVLLSEENKVFGKYYPEDIIDIDSKDASGKYLLDDHQKNFIYEFAVWIYRAICVFNKTKNDIIYHRLISQMGKGKKVLSNTYLDIILSIITFNRENQDFFTFILKNIHSGFNKINWIKTISKSQAIMQDGMPLYMNPVNKKRSINFDEELFVIYFSILNYIQHKFGFHVNINLGFQLIKGKKFSQYLNGVGARRLLQIKYKYFSDKALMLWELCFAFFNKSHQIRINSEQKEYLLAKNFYIVFEAIIDELLGDKDLPQELKSQKDGKRVDHMYKYKGLVEQHCDTPIYYIGDSKYYKTNTSITEESIYKQWTYARNVIQWNLDLFLDGKLKGESMLRDDVTEGYNIIPNFFISARLNEKLDYSDSSVTQTERPNKFFRSRQFENRLFDRDTLLVYHYDVNFLYVVSLYAKENRGLKDKWKAEVRKQFRKEIQNELQTKYKFYAMSPKEGVAKPTSQFIQENFKLLNGKLYNPYGNSNMLSLSLSLDEANSVENSIVLRKLREHFDIVECKLGENPIDKLQAYPEQTAFNGTMDDYVVIGNYHDEAQKNFILENKLYYARLELREGRFLNLGYEAMVAKYLLLYKNGEENELYRLEGNGPRIMTNAQLKNEVVTDPRDVKNYICYPLHKITPEKNVDLTKFTAVQGGIYFRTLREILNGNQQ